MTVKGLAQTIVDNFVDLLENIIMKWKEFQISMLLYFWSDALLWALTGCKIVNL